MEEEYIEDDSIDSGISIKLGKRINIVLRC